LHFILPNFPLLRPQRRIYSFNTPALCQPYLINQPFLTALFNFYAFLRCFILNLHGTLSTFGSIITLKFMIFWVKMPIDAMQR